MILALRIMLAISIGGFLVIYSSTHTSLVSFKDDIPGNAYALGWVFFTLFSLLAALLGSEMRKIFSIVALCGLAVALYGWYALHLPAPNIKDASIGKATFLVIVAAILNVLSIFMQKS